MFAIVSLLFETLLSFVFFLALMSLDLEIAAHLGVSLAGD